MARLPSFDPISFLVTRKFGPRSQWAEFPPSLNSFRTPVRQDPELAKRVREYRAELGGLSRDALQKLVEGEQQKLAHELTAKAEAEERAQFFNQPSARADFDHWSKAAHWTLDEAIALSFGRSPEKVGWETIKVFYPSSPFAVQFYRRRDLARKSLRTTV